MRIYKIIVLIFLLIGTLFSCQNTEADLLNYEIVDQEAVTIIDHQTRQIDIAFSEQFCEAKDVCAKFQVSDGADVYVNNVLQESGESRNNFEEPFTFVVVSEDQMASDTWNIKSQNNNITPEWGLGGFLSEEASHNRKYDWYIDQAQTGTMSDYNCAPSCVVMAGKWKKENFSYTVEDAREVYHPKGGGWFTEDIDSCLTYFSIDHAIIPLSVYRDSTAQILVNELKAGNIILLAIDVDYLNENFEKDRRVGKYYHTIALGTGHCIVLKGYKKVDGNIFFEVYDPIGYDYKYSDGSYKGVDRYYFSDDVYTAAFASWNYAFVIYGPGTKSRYENMVQATEIKSILVL